MSVYGSSVGNGLDRLLVLIPAWQPDDRLLALVSELDMCGFAGILVVDDGSSPSSVFEELERNPTVTVGKHGANLGKGRALKTGIDLVLHEMPHIHGIVTADADGQHTAADIVRVAGVLSRETTSMVLGVRAFDGDVPLRCRLGNTLTRGAFRLLTGVKLSDTQTGLRGIPRSLLGEALRLQGERYEYEMVVLAYFCRTGRRPVEVPIETVYLDGNRSSHFKPLGDSLRILFALVYCVLRCSWGCV